MTTTPTTVKSDSKAPDSKAVIGGLLYKGDANVAISNGVATGANPGVSPPNYLQVNHYFYHHRAGENARVAPVLLGMEDPSLDLNYPSRAFIATLGPPEWVV
jgi:hypothetical protein